MGTFCLPSVKQEPGSLPGKYGFSATMQLCPYEKSGVTPFIVFRFLVKFPLFYGAVGGQ
jgi:hypothetical protein